MPALLHGIAALLRRLRFAPPGRRVLPLAAALCILTAGTATAGMLEDRLADTRRQAKAVRGQQVAVDRRQQRLVGAVRTLGGRIRDLDAPIRTLTGEIEDLESDIAEREARIVQLKRDHARQQREIVRLGLEYRAAQDLLATRLVAAYVSGDDEMLGVIARAGSVDAIFDRRDALAHIVGIDRQVIRRITATERTMRLKRARNYQVRRDIVADIASIAEERTQVAAARAEVAQRQGELEAVKAERDAVLEQLGRRERELDGSLDRLEEDSEQLQEAIREGARQQSSTVPGGPSPSGMLWPVNGPVVSTFGPRWGRMHEGLDIAVPAGTPILAAATGVVTHAGWMDGYGNLVIVQHAGSVSTAYAHQSQIGVGVGQTVTQGQVVGQVGCTGHCYGDHLHFETRTSGGAVDPFGYL